ncbi:MAG TPA: ammonium transporter [Polyangiaceae bacterium]|nr:ammonium transporter [Polyangiaceae bacterium]
MFDPTLQEVAKQSADAAQGLGQITISANLLWTCVTAFLVMFMQAGFALVETGLTRSKNVAHTMAMNFLVYAIGIIGFWSIGFGLQMGGVGALGTFGGETTLNQELVIQVGGKTWGLLGTTGFFLPLAQYTPAVAATFLFQMVFMDTTATIPTGALAERWKFSTFIVFSFVISTIIYPVYANWVWGGGWLSALGRNYQLGHGHVDFAGSSVVHMTGGVAALVCAKLLGPRIGKYNADGTPNPIPGHNIPMAVLGTFILAFGWFGFNPGSTLAASDTRFAVVAVNTMLASASGALSATLYGKLKFGKPDPTWMCNGMLAGLVAITAPCAFVSSATAIFIGAVSGLIVIVSALFVETTLKIDDPVGAISVHGVNGAWGILALGLFSNGTYGEGYNGVAGTVKGLFYGDSGQFFASLIGIGANIAYVGIMAGFAFWVIGRLMGGHRVSREVELAGLDVPEMGVDGYVGDPGISLPDEAPGGPHPYYSAHAAGGE